MLGAGKEGGEWARQGKGSAPETNNQKPSKRGQTSKKIDFPREVKQVRSQSSLSTDVKRLRLISL